MLRVEVTENISPILSDNSMEYAFCNSCKPAGLGFGATFLSCDEDEPERLVGSIKFFPNGAGELVCYDMRYLDAISDIFYKTSGEERPRKLDSLVYCKTLAKGRDEALAEYINLNSRQPGQHFKKQSISYMIGDTALFIGCKEGEEAKSIEYGVEYKGGVEKAGEITVTESGKAYIECILPELYDDICRDFVKIFGDDRGIPRFEELREGFNIRSENLEYYKRIKNLVEARGISLKPLDEQVRGKMLIRGTSQKNKKDGDKLH